MSLTYNYANLKELRNRDIKLQVTFHNITNKNRGSMKSPTPEAQCAVGAFQKQYPICAVNFTNNISKSDWTWHSLWKLVTVNFRNKYFLNSVDWSGLYLQVYIPSWLIYSI